jgi:glycosyltransferase involved in cell wall biosynthesis
MLDTHDIVVVSDMFVEDYVGGAELTTEAIIQQSRLRCLKVRSNKVTSDMISKNRSKIWIFGNFAAIDPRLLLLFRGMKYAVLEYDYKFCRHRSPEKHAFVEGRPCDCANSPQGKLIETFYTNASMLFWMSENQKNVYLRIFPSLKQQINETISSVFDLQTLELLKVLREETNVRSKWLILGSNSWVKGYENAKKWCTDNNLEYEVVWNLPYQELLKRLASAEGFVYLPAGSDTCPRMVIEAKLLGCKLIINENVQHSTEPWFNATIDETETYLRNSPERFWHHIDQLKNFRHTISGYTTTYNCESQEYPYEECITSMLQFCDEVCVVDGGSTDGTFEKLLELALAEPKLKIKSIPRDWKSPGYAVFDGMQKAEARKLCTGDFCWQMDSDEIVHEVDVPKIIELIQTVPKDIDIVALPVIEYWGGQSKVRMDINPQKWRLSRNKPYITHGIPRAHRRFDIEGKLFSAGSDGCDMIHIETFEPIPTVGFFNNEAIVLQQRALKGDKAAHRMYENWFNDVVKQLPGVHHYSWYNIERKIRLYRQYWSAHWVTLSGTDFVDNAENNMFFDVPWHEVTDEMITSRAKELSTKTGGHIFHQKWSGKTTPWINIKRAEPKLMLKVEK